MLFNNKPIDSNHNPLTTSVYYQDLDVEGSIYPQNALVLDGNDENFVVLDGGSTILLLDSGI